MIQIVAMVLVFTAAQADNREPTSRIVGDDSLGFCESRLTSVFANPCEADEVRRRLGIDRDGVPRAPGQTLLGRAICTGGLGLDGCEWAISIYSLLDGRGKVEYAETDRASLLNGDSTPEVARIAVEISTDHARRMGSLFSALLTLPRAPVDIAVPLDGRTYTFAVNQPQNTCFQTHAPPAGSEGDRLLRAVTSLRRWLLASENHSHSTARAVPDSILEQFAAREDSGARTP